MAFVVPDELRTLRQSDFGTGLSCGRKLWIGKVDGLRRPSTKKQIYGSAFHKGVENLYRSVKLGDRLDYLEAKAEAVESVKVAFALADPEILELEEGETVQSATAVAGGLVLRGLDYYIASVFPGIISLGDPAAIEERLEFEYRGFQLNGTIDLIDGNACLVDHKFSGMYLTKRWPDSYLSQLGRYAWFLEKSKAPIADIRLDMISYARANRKKDPLLEYHPYTLADAGVDLPTLIRLGKESVDALLDMIEAGIFPRAGANSFGLGCGNCGFKGALCESTPAALSAPAAPSIALAS